MTSMQNPHATTSSSFHRRLPPLHALEVFAAAARCGTFSKAARELFVTQGAVSRQIQQLEQHLGVTCSCAIATGCGQRRKPKRCCR